MNELIPITYANDRPAVSARELHEFLKVGTRFNDWFARMKEYGFSEGTDFYSKMSKTTEQGGRPAVDYVLSLDMARELCMIQYTDMARALQIANKQLASVKSDNKMLTAKSAQQE